EFVGVYGNRSHSVSANLNGAKKRAVELVVAEIGMFLAGIPDQEIDQVFAFETADAAHASTVEKGDG
ncbi:MAG: hypothetical protein AAGJ68_01165, partial [Pseudomonadota bacterium]